jgi:hypothetical protein
MYRISHDGQERIIDVDPVEAIAPALRSSKPGKYTVEAISADPLPSGHTSRRLGVTSSRPDKSAAIEAAPWPAEHVPA